MALGIHAFQLLDWPVEGRWDFGLEELDNVINGQFIAVLLGPSTGHTQNPSVMSDPEMYYSSCGVQERPDVVLHWGMLQKIRNETTKQI